jgi:TolB-like protein
MSFFAELKRRNVFRVGIAYVVTAWLLIQVADILLETIGAPVWVMQTLFVVLGIGLVIALIFAWAYELTPDGLRREKDVDRSQSMTHVTRHKLNNLITGVLVLALAYFVIDKFVINKAPVAPGPVTAREPVSVRAPEPLPKDQAVPQQDQKSIVVLPFVNMSNDPEQEFFSDGLSEELLNVLAQIKDLRVISRTSAFAFKGKDIDIPTIAEQLNVTHVLEGSVRKSGNSVRITAQLIKVETDSHLWSEAYNRELENIFEIQEEISKAIAAELQVTLGTAASQRKPTENLEAWQLFLRGRHLYQNRGQEQMARAMALLKQAVSLDPGFADAWANLAAANVVYAYNVDEGFEKIYDDGRQAALRAIEVDPKNGFAHAVLGMLHYAMLDWDQAMQAFDLAIELNPNETNTLLWKGISLLSLGYVNEAIDMFHKAERLDPIFTNVHNWLALAFSIQGEARLMQRHLDKMKRLDPEFEGFIWTNPALMAGNLDAAEETMREFAIERTGDDALVVAMFSALKDPARKDEAIQTMLANKHLAEWADLVPYLWNIGAVEETLANFWGQRENGRLLRSVNSLNFFWYAFNRALLSNPVMPAFFEANGMVEYWRKHGDPDYCRVTGNSVTCEGS